jgi:predicted RNase H-like nuclease (RuvC/YqgF family)
MQSETQRVREEKPSQQPAQNVRQQTAIDESDPGIRDHKTFRAAVVIGLVTVGGLSLFLPDQEGDPTDDVMAMTPASIESPDEAQHALTGSEPPQTAPAYTAIDRKLDTLTGQVHRGFEALRTDGADVKHALSTLAKRFDETQAAIVELHQGNEALSQKIAESQTQLKTLAQAVKSLKVVKRQATAKKPRPVVSTPPFHIDAIDRWDDRTYVAVSQQGQVSFLKSGEQQSGWTVTQLDRLKGQVGFRGPAGQAYTVSLQR